MMVLCCMQPAQEWREERKERRKFMSGGRKTKVCGERDGREWLWVKKGRRREGYAWMEGTQDKHSNEVCWERCGRVVVDEEMGRCA